jgi:hypothetical protein
VAVSQNPFDRYDIDPRLGPTEITARFRDLISEAKTEEERADLRAAWEDLTLHPRDRLVHALATWPEAREEIPLGVDEDERPAPPSMRVEDLRLLDLLAPPEIGAALVEPPSASAKPSAKKSVLADDPFLAEIK